MRSSSLARGRSPRRRWTGLDARDEELAAAAGQRRSILATSSIAGADRDSAPRDQRRGAGACAPGAARRSVRTPSSSGSAAGEGARAPARGPVGPADSLGPALLGAARTRRARVGARRGSIRVGRLRMLSPGRSAVRAVDGRCSAMPASRLGRAVRRSGRPPAAARCAVWPIGSHWGASGRILRGARARKRWRARRRASARGRAPAVSAMSAPQERWTRLPCSARAVLTDAEPRPWPTVRSPTRPRPRRRPGVLAPRRGEGRWAALSETRAARRPTPCASGGRGAGPIRSTSRR